ncbi:MAG: hypothetical protein NUV65_03330 [Candidatus Roizmanbacteria bacterium]|nr:hypothetical protein [Candidatus Roizmanbacteria bacterium]
MEELRNVLASIDFIGLSIKIVGVLFSVGYLGFSIIFLQRLTKLDRTYTAPSTRTLFAFAWVQIAIGTILILYALFLL